MPPVWMVAEIMTFGELSRWTSLLADGKLRQEIADRFSLRERQFVSIIKHLVDVRNTCAHHNRLWNRGFRNPPQLPKKPEDLNQTLDHTSVGYGAGRLYNSLVLIAYLVSRVAPGSSWRDDLMELFKTQSTHNLNAMGFPPDWRTRSRWR